MRGLVRTALAATLLTVGAGARDAAAQSAPSSPVKVTWVGPAECPPSAELEASIRTLLRTSTKRGPEVEARVVVVRQPDDRYRAEVHTQSGGHAGRRTFQAATCRSLADATALLLALMIDPDAARGAAALPAPAAPQPPQPPDARPPQPVPASGPTDRATVAPPPPPPPPPPPRPRFSLSARAQLGAIVDVGTLPRAQVGIEGALGVDYGPLLFLLGGAVWPSTSYADVGNTVAGSLSLVDARLSVCARPLALAASSFPLWLCLGPGFEHESATLPSLADAHPAHDWFSLVGGLALEPRVGRFGLQLRADAAVPFRRQSFLADQASEVVFTPSAVAFRGSAGLVVHFP